MKTTATRLKIMVTGDGRGVVGHAGARLFADLADTTGLTSTFGQALAGLRQCQRGHDPGRIAVDLAVMLADGGETIADLAVLRDQPGLFGPIASDPTAWRLLSQLDTTMLTELRAARAHAREVAWAQHAEVRGDLPQPTVAGQQVDGLVLRLWTVRPDRRLTAERQLTGARDAIFGLAFSLDGTVLAAVTNDGQALIWHPADSVAAPRTLPHSATLHGVQFTTGGRSLATAGRTVSCGCGAPQAAMSRAGSPGRSWRR